jgi:hypothetical protein
MAGCPHQDIISGAGYDTVYLTRVAPTAMTFVPCVGGISHNEIEDAKPADLTAGCNVLLNAVLDRANAAPSGEDRWPGRSPTLGGLPLKQSGLSDCARDIAYYVIEHKM